MMKKLGLLELSPTSFAQRHLQQATVRRNEEHKGRHEANSTSTLMARLQFDKYMNFASWFEDDLSKNKWHCIKTIQNDKKMTAYMGLFNDYVTPRGWVVLKETGLSLW